MNISSFSTRLIRWSFYLLFFLVPIIFNGDTKELFEFNKMWLTFGLALVIAAAWITKMITQRQVKIQRTILDIPIVLFLFSQLLSTIFSIDPHISWWGYYERFNGGFLSLFTYVLLYYAFATNLRLKDVWKMIQVSLVSGAFVALWGLPSHFGYDPSCFVFRGTLDVSCWTAAFQPKVRIFSTIGQPDWLAAYLSVLLPISFVFAIRSFTTNENVSKKHVSSIMNYVLSKRILLTIYYLLLTLLFYIDILFTKSKGSFAALAIVLPLLLLGIIWVERKQKTLLYVTGVMAVIILLLTFYIGTPFYQLDRFTFASVWQSMHKPTTTSTINSAAQQAAQQQANAITGELGGTDSGKIRLLVWRGAIDAWLHNPILGTGVETFAFAYYQYRPAAHNLTSEWDYLYNKAHNEYLNYLATTGALGLGTYIAIIALFLFWVSKYLYKTRQDTSFEKLVVIAIVAAYLSILISNFFGFSVVIINIYFFLLPLFSLFLANEISEHRIISLPLRDTKNEIQNTTPFQWIGITVSWLIALYCIVVLINFWNADKSYAYGYNLDHAGQYQNAYQYLHDAMNMRTDEPVFWDELAANDAVLAQALFEQKDTANAQKLAQEALQVSTMEVTQHPHNVVFWKTRVRVMYALAQIDPTYLKNALSAIQAAQALAPTDAKISYNLGLLYAQNGDVNQAIATLQHTIKLKPDYRDAYYALGILLHQQAVDKNNTIKNQQKEQQAVAAMHFILDTLKINDQQAKSALTSWGEK